MRQSRLHAPEFAIRQLSVCDGTLNKLASTGMNSAHPHGCNLAIYSRRLAALTDRQEEQAEQGKDICEDGVDAIRLG